MATDRRKHIAGNIRFYMAEGVRFLGSFCTVSHRTVLRVFYFHNPTVRVRLNIIARCGTMRCGLVTLGKHLAAPYWEQSTRL